MKENFRVEIAEWMSNQSTEVIVRRRSVKKKFLKVSQNSQENTCAEVTFK